MLSIFSRLSTFVYNVSIPLTASVLVSALYPVGSRPARFPPPEPRWAKKKFIFMIFFLIKNYTSTADVGIAISLEIILNLLYRYYVTFFVVSFWFFFFKFNLLLVVILLTI